MVKRLLYAHRLTITMSVKFHFEIHIDCW